MDLPSSTISGLMERVLTNINVFTCPHILEHGIPYLAIQLIRKSILSVKRILELILTMRPCVEVDVSKVDF